MRGREEVMDKENVTLERVGGNTGLYEQTATVKRRRLVWEMPYGDVTMDESNEVDVEKDSEGRQSTDRSGLMAPNRFNLGAGEFF